MNSTEKFKEMYVSQFETADTSIFQEVIDAILNLSKIKSNFVIAIDGKCGSGKSSFAKTLAESFDFDIIHMDDFFLPLELRVPKRLSECGGNVHYERFSEEVASNLIDKKPFNYKKFSCKLCDYDGTQYVSCEKPVIIEGAYCMREEFVNLYDLKIFFDINPHKQKERIIERNGNDGYENFKNIWIPKEEAYFSNMNIKEKCDMSVLIK